MRLPRSLVVFGVVLAAGVGNAVAILVPKATASAFEPERVVVRSFDRFHARPAEVGNQAGEMNSVTVTDWGLGYTYRYRESATEDHCCRRHTTITIIAFNVNGHQNTTVFMPRDGTGAIKAHEQAHVDLNEYAYGQAAVKAEAFSRRMLHRTFEGDCLADAKARLNDCFDGEFRRPYARWRDELHRRLNELDHDGHDGGMPPAKAYARVIAENG